MVWLLTTVFLPFVEASMVAGARKTFLSSVYGMASRVTSESFVEPKWISERCCLMLNILFARIFAENDVKYCPIRHFNCPNLHSRLMGVTITLQVHPSYTRVIVVFNRKASNNGKR